MQEIANQLNCSLDRVHYWMNVHGIERRSRAETNYLRQHPNGDPFKFIPPSTPEQHMLYGAGLGLYWGEGNKANKNSVRLGNTDPQLILVFVCFLEAFYSISRQEMKFSLQIFSDVNKKTPYYIGKTYCK